MDYLVRIEAPHFVAGLICDKNHNCIETAPILYWGKGKNMKWIYEYCNKRKWKVLFYKNA